nr:hypothetical protein CFP56_06118 [Quercus suber]
MLLELNEKIKRELSRLKFGTDANVVEVIQCDTTNEMLCLPNEASMLNPPCVRSKGLRNTRLKGHLEKCNANTSRDASSSTSLCVFLPSSNSPTFLPPLSWQLQVCKVAPIPGENTVW